GVHVGGGLVVGQVLIVGIAAVVSVVVELVRRLAELLLILGHEGLGLLVLGVGVEGGQQHDALGQGGIKAFHGEDAVHAVHAEPLGGVAHAVGLGQDQGSGLIVHGQEDQVSAVVL